MKRKRKQERKQDRLIEIPEEVRIPGTDVILEKGDKIRVNEALPTLSNIEGKRVLEVRTFEDHALLLFEGNYTLLLRDWSWRP